MQTDLQKFTLEELKSMAYDTISRLEQEKKTLSVLNNLIAQKKKEADTEPN
jgi:hypothetical protein